MQNIILELDRICGICHVPMTLVCGDGQVLHAWPNNQAEGIHPFAFQAVVEDFRLQKRDAQYPLINYLGSGFLLGTMEVAPDVFLLIGMVSPYYQSRKEILSMLHDVVSPQHLQSYCDYLLQIPLLTLQQLKDYMHLLGKLLLELEIPAENILLMDILSAEVSQTPALERNLFEQREEPEFHVPVDFEEGICKAIETGNRTQLEQCIYSPVRGRVGRMSSSELRQQKYSFICMATLASRAAILGGLPLETAFSLSDLYCQRMDMLSEIPSVQNLTYTMLTDYCDRVREIQKRPRVSPVIQNCLSYISVHLHEAVNLEQLSQHCGLCSRSLSIRFKKEMGMGIPEYIHQEKLKEAEYLLRNSGYTISEITSFLNYPSQSYFTQIFKKYNHTTPQQFRDARR